MVIAEELGFGVAVVGTAASFTERNRSVSTSYTHIGSGLRSKIIR